MPRPFPARPRRTPLAALTLISIAAAVAFAINSRADDSPAAQGQSHHSAPPAGERVEAEVITLRPSGFDPAEITRPRGRFYLAVENRSGTHDLDLRLSREAGGRLVEVRLPRGRLKWRGMIDPPPGTYTLTEAGRPDWVCRVTITAQ